jgi:hypothetical protein
VIQILIGQRVLESSLPRKKIIYICLVRVFLRDKGLALEWAKKWYGLVEVKRWSVSCSIYFLNFPFSTVLKF